MADRVLDIKNVEFIHELSPIQEAILLHGRTGVEPKHPCGQLTCLLQGPLNVSAFEKAWQDVVKRYAILRASFRWKRVKKPLQLTSKELDVSVQQYDWRSSTSQEQEQKWQALTREEWVRGFDPSAPPLMRLNLCRIADGAYRFVWTFHSLLLDEMSAHSVFRRACALYDEPGGRETDLREESFSFRDYLSWSGQSGSSGSESYWQEALRGFGQPTALPLDNGVPSGWNGTVDYGFLRARLSVETDLAAPSTAENSQPSLETIVSVAWAVLLSRYSGEEDIVFGVAFSTRPGGLIGAEGLIGPLTNVLPLRVNLSSYPCVASLLQDFKKRLAEMAAKANCSLARVRQFAGLPDEAPLFESCVIVGSGLPDRTPTMASGKVEIRSARLIEAPSSPITLKALAGQPCELEIVYDRSRFDRPTVDRMFGHLQNLIAGMAREPEARHSDLPLLTEAELDQVLREWNDTATGYRREKTIHELFAEQVESGPDEVAVVFGDQFLTYRELDRRANQVARYLRGLGVGAEVLVGACFERSLEMVVGLLGILKAGGAYVPLDATYPLERLAFMLADTQVPVLLTQERLLDRLPTHWGHAICLDSDWDSIACQDDTALPDCVGPENLAYVMYTSGSTGQPKGVSIVHRNVVRLVKNANYVKLDSEEVLMQLAPISFDAATFEIWGALLNGAKLVVMYEASPSLEELGDALRRYGVSTLWLTAGLFHLIVDERLEDLNSVNQLLAGGDVLSASHVVRVLARFPKTRLINGYGPTEGTTFSCCYVMQGHESFKGSVPIGRPISNTEAYILDKHMRPVSVGVVGELYIGGDGLGRGYHYRPDMTAERFVPHPSGKEIGARLYKSGDLVRYLSDGRIEFLGRRDNQVKVRGFRVELGEIEKALNSHRAVQDSIVIAQEGEGASKRLLAYLIASEDAIADGDLRSYLKEKLPDFMLPSAFVRMDKFPLNPNGKVNRKALPPPDQVRPELSDATAAPRTPVEEKLVAIWKKVLRLERVGIQDNFFDLGGDSILSIQISLLANQAGLKLAPKHLFQFETIADLAQAVETASPSPQQQGPVTGTLPLTPIQCHFFHHRPLNAHHWNQAIMFELRQTVAPALLETCIGELLAHHDALRLRFKETGTGWEQYYAALDDETGLTVIDLSALAESDRREAIEEAAAMMQASLNLGEGPMMRVGLIEPGGGEAQRLVIMIHHLVVDGVSWRILLTDLEMVYGQVSRGERVELGAKSTSYKRWAERLREYAASEQAESELEYWLKQAQVDEASLPLDFSNGPNTEGSAARVSLSLTVEETQALVEEVPRFHKTQINDVLLAALWRCISRRAGTNSLRIDLEGHGREEMIEGVDVSRTVGWFTSLFPVRLEVEPGSSLAEALKSVKQQLRSIPNRGIGYGVLRYLSEDGRISESLARAPESEIVFNYLGQTDQVLMESALLRESGASCGPAKSPNALRSHLLEIVAIVERGRFQMSWVYSKNLHKRSTIEELARSYMEELRSLIGNSTLQETASYTPSDFPLAELDQDKLDKVLSKVKWR